jgi:protein SCO1/2
MVRSFLLLILGGLLFGSAGCKQGNEARPGEKAAGSKDTNTQIFQVKGVIIEVKPQEKTVEIKHEAIPGYMEAMTMPFEVKDTNELANLAPGDTVAFRMTVTETDGWIDQIRKLSEATPATNNLPTTGPFRHVRDVEPLDVGDTLPEYHFTNQLSQPISTRDYKGQALAINFIFTRCPFPTFCPLTANNFAEAQRKLKGMTNGPANWQLLTITIDPEFDKPAILKAYGERHDYDPAHWTLATGELIDITAIAEQLGQTFWRDETGSISHNMRAIVIDASGRIQRIIGGNKWNADELTEEIVKAAGKRS